MAVAVAFGNGQHFILRSVALFALNVAISSLRQQRRGSGQESVSRVDFVQGVARNHEE